MPPFTAATAQSGFDRRFEWGLLGSQRLASEVDVLVLVDVLSFSTAVDVAVARGATIIPALWADDRAADLATELGAFVAAGRSELSSAGGYSLSPVSLAKIPAGTRLVLPSPNGATICAGLAGTPVTIFAGCLRNAEAVARASAVAGDTIGVVAAGEKWPDGSLRQALEDVAGGGAILAALGGTPSPEARAAIAIAREVDSTLLADCASARELVALGFADDVAMAMARETSHAAPVLRDGAFIDGAA
jgi:2-phosphosulfolactate phosphatase